MPSSYYATRLSDNIATTPEGFLLCKDAVLARTGSQRYALRELPDEAVQDLEAKAGPDGMVDVFRPEEEVFSPQSMASLEGKPVTYDHPSGGRFVDPANVKELQQGHVQNIRKGVKPLPSGDMPLIGDILITHEPLISKVKDGLRELSAGYDYRLIRRDGRLTQTDLVHNHIACVPHARAGVDVRIKDAAPSLEESSDNKEKERPMKKDLFRRIFGLGLQAYAKDAKPEDMAEAVEAMKQQPPEKKVDDEVCEEEQPVVPKKKAAPLVAPVVADDRKRLHAVLDRLLDEEEKPEEEPVKKPEPAPEEAREMADRTRLHAALDKFLKTGNDKRADDRRADDTKALDVDIRELRDLLDEYLAEEEKEPEHAADEPPPGEGDLEEGEETFEEAEPEPEAEDSKEEEIIEPISAAPGKEADRRARDAAEASFLRRIRPVIARSKDSNAISDFNARLRNLTGKTRVSTRDAGYAKFSEATSTRDESNATPGSDRDAVYAKLHRQGNPSSVINELLKQ